MRTLLFIPPHIRETDGQSIYTEIKNLSLQAGLTLLESSVFAVSNWDELQDITHDEDLWDSYLVPLNLMTSLVDKKQLQNDMQELKKFASRSSRSNIVAYLIPGLPSLTVKVKTDLLKAGILFVHEQDDGSELLKLQLEVAARLRTNNLSSMIRIGPIEIDLHGQILLINHEQIKLSRHEFHILSCLAADIGQPVSKSRIYNSLYESDSHVDSQIIDKFLEHLRKKISIKGYEKLGHLLIETVKGFGIKLLTEDALKEKYPEIFSARALIEDRNLNSSAPLINMGGWLHLKINPDGSSNIGNGKTLPPKLTEVFLYAAKHAGEKLDPKKGGEHLFSSSKNSQDNFNTAVSRLRKYLTDSGYPEIIVKTKSGSLFRTKYKDWSLEAD